MQQRARGTTAQHTAESCRSTLGPSSHPSTHHTPVQHHRVTLALLLSLLPCCKSSPPLPAFKANSCGLESLWCGLDQDTTQADNSVMSEPHTCLRPVSVTALLSTQEHPDTWQHTCTCNQCVHTHVHACQWVQRRRRSQISRAARLC